MSASKIFSRHGIAATPSKRYRSGVSLPQTKAPPAIAVLAVQAAVCGLVIGFSYVGFALAWNMQMEASRQLDASYQSRISAADSSIGDLKRSIQMLDSRYSIEQWAQENGYTLDGTATAATLDKPQTSVSR